MTPGCLCECMSVSIIAGLCVFVPACLDVWKQKGVWCFKVEPSPKLTRHLFGVSSRPCEFWY